MNPMAKTPKRRTLRAALKHLRAEIRLHPYLYLMVLPAMIWFLLFCYLPMGGIVMAFQDFRPTRGFFHSLGNTLRSNRSVAPTIVQISGVTAPLCDT